MEELLGKPLEEKSNFSGINALSPHCDRFLLPAQLPTPPLTFPKARDPHPPWNEAGAGHVLNPKEMDEGRALGL